MYQSLAPRLNEIPRKRTNSALEVCDGEHAKASGVRRLCDRLSLHCRGLGSDVEADLAA